MLLQIWAGETTGMDTVSMQTLRSVQTFNVVGHVDIGRFTGPICKPAIVDSIKVNVVQLDWCVAVGGRRDADHM